MVILLNKGAAFADYSDLDKHECTIEEREVQPTLDNGTIVFAGVDYEAIYAAEKEVDIIVWDGGNNDFFVSDLPIVVADPHRAGHELLHYPSETNARLADVFVINKVDTANLEDVITVRKTHAEPRRCDR